MSRFPAVLVVALCLASRFLHAAEPSVDLKAALSGRILSPDATQNEVATLVASRIAPIPEPTSVADWERYAQRVPAGCAR